MRKPKLIYKQLTGEYEGLSVTSDGKVFRNGHLMKPHYNNCGYLRVRVQNKKTKTKYSVHRLIAMAFLPNPNNLPVVMHLDNDKTNNKVSNLKWGTHSENTKQAYNEGRLTSCYKKGIGNGLYGDNHPISKLTEKQRREVKKLYSTGKYTKTELGRIYGVTRLTIARYV